MFISLFNLMGMMFLLMAAGFLLMKTGLMNKAGKKSFVNVLLYFIMPCYIINSFLIDTGDDFWATSGKIFFIALIINVLQVVIATFCYNMMSKTEKPVYQYGMVCPNAGFMGNPLCEGVFGSLGSVHAAIFLIPQRFVMWTAGMTYFSKDEGNVWKAIKKVLKHPCIIGLYIGTFLMITQIQLPEVIKSTISTAGRCNTAMVMIYIGTILVDIDFKALLNWHQFYAAFMRLIFAPVIVYVGCRIFGVDPYVTGVCTLLTATPSGSTTSILAAQYGADEVAAANNVVLSTLLSVITLPLWSAFLLSQL